MVELARAFPILPTLVVSLVLAGPNATAAKYRKPVEPTPEVVSLKFDWGSGLTARVEMTRSRSRTPGPSERRVPSAHTMVAERQDDGSYIVSGKDYRPLVESDGAPMVPKTDFDGPILGALDPAIRVSQGGDYMGLADYERARADVLKIFRELVPWPDKPEVQAEIKAHFESLMTREVMEQHVSGSWSAFVGNWAGAELELGQEYESVDEVQLPIPGSPATRQLTSVSILERTACDDAQPRSSLDCVHLRMVTRLDPDETRKAIKSSAEQRAAPGTAIPDSQLTDIQIDVEIDVVANPDTLQPYRGSWRSTGVFTTLEKGVEKSTTQTESTIATWMYLPQTVPAAVATEQG